MQYNSCVFKAKKIVVNNILNCRNQQIPLISKHSFLGGIKAFAENIECVLKWYMNRSYQKKSYRKLLNLARFDPSNDPYKLSRPLIQNSKFKTLLIFQGLNI